MHLFPGEVLGKHNILSIIWIMVQISETFIRCLLVFGNLNFRQCRKMITDDQNLIHFLTTLQILWHHRECVCAKIAVPRQQSFAKPDANHP